MVQRSTEKHTCEPYSESVFPVPGQRRNINTTQPNQIVTRLKKYSTEATTKTTLRQLAYMRPVLFRSQIPKRRPSSCRRAQNRRDFCLLFLFSSMTLYSTTQRCVRKEAPESRRVKATTQLCCCWHVACANPYESHLFCDASSQQHQWRWVIPGPMHTNEHRSRRGVASVQCVKLRTNLKHNILTDTYHYHEAAPADGALTFLGRPCMSPTLLH